MSAEKWIAALNYIQQFRTQLENWGITQQVLIGIGLVCTIVLLVSLREVAGWVLRVPHMRKEIHSLRLQVTEMHKTLNEMNEKLMAGVMADEGAQESEAEPQKACRPQFRLDH